MLHPRGGPARAQWACLVVGFSVSAEGYSKRLILESSNSIEEAARSASGSGDVRESLIKMVDGSHYCRSQGPAHQTWAAPQKTAS